MPNFWVVTLLSQMSDKEVRGASCLEAPQALLEGWVDRTAFRTLSRRAECSALVGKQTSIPWSSNT